MSYVGNSIRLLKNEFRDAGAAEYLTLTNTEASELVYEAEKEIEDSFDSNQIKTRTVVRAERVFKGIS
jgi:hypothetical protein